MFTDNVRAQHQKIVDVIKQMGALAAVPNTIDATKGDKLRKLLVDLSSLVTLHLATEDQVLYPELKQDPNPKVAAIAQRFADEMGGIGASFKDYLSHWRNGAMIQSNSATFSKETKAIALALTSRIEREERELYPLVE